MDTIHPAANLAEVVLRLLLAAAIGSAIGLNRELQSKPAGLRTHALVALGAALMTLIALALPGGDPAISSAAISRVLQGVIVGIGFIGGGVILHRDDTKGVHGLTTAAAIWVVAAAGIAIGGGMWQIGLVAGALTLIVLALGEIVDQWLHRRAEPRSGE